MKKIVACFENCEQPSTAKQALHTVKFAMEKVCKQTDMQASKKNQIIKIRN
jgi:hypothetical protein